MAGFDELIFRQAATHFIRQSVPLRLSNSIEGMAACATRAGQRSKEKS